MEPGEVGHFFLVEGYLWDWLVAAAGIVINLVIPANVVKPIRRYYNVTDVTLMYPDHDSSVPSLALYLLVFVLPAVVFGVTALLKRSAGLVDWHHGALSVAEGFALATGFKRWINLLGVYRPSWITALEDGNADTDYRLSYPSGHSAYIFFSMTIVTLYVVGKAELLHRPSQLLFLKMVCAIAPMALAAFVAVSRIADYKHAPADVNAGCFIGVACGLVAYFLNYNSPFDEESALPKRRGQAAVVARAASVASKAAAAAVASGRYAVVPGSQPLVITETAEDLAAQYGASAGLVAVNGMPTRRSRMTS
ncbi:hypothetical protein HYH03_013078 [Edaphochlamys debaryana]|uniref:Phosphatidic acid phosphatase type 2/haloperoxidase domain-containing protein n=1 Tax=Edaphochlamys debaryana TaxID=47281 RepID=A0A835XRQ2_9CHLO|nr:hypothetical protein HYH03_013078 [Edaphochlamys debaryana]|eukprot:KAG2488392.1 hypothetical protein HYH03_013078 [Edaphochlamys debaryana]